MICLDSHALLWWALEPERLSERASALCRQMEAEGGCISSISIWELGEKIRKGRLDIGMRIEDFARMVRSSGAIEIVPVDDALWMAGLELDWDHKDPADRTIVATARQFGVPLLTKDGTIHAFPLARAIW